MKPRAGWLVVIGVARRRQGDELRVGSATVLPLISLARAVREGRAAALAVLLTVGTDAGRVEQALRSGESACPGCSVPPAGPGAASVGARRAESVAAAAAVCRPRATHVLVLARRTDAAAVIAAPLLAEAAGQGDRLIATRWSPARWDTCAGDRPASVHAGSPSPPSTRHPNPTLIRVGGGGFLDRGGDLPHPPPGRAPPSATGGSLSTITLSC